MKNIINSVLNVEVSYFKNIKDITPISVNLLDILTDEGYKLQSEKLRKTTHEETRVKIKSSIPCITPSGLFSRRNGDSLIKHSGLIQFDIDFKDNQGIENYINLKGEISKIQNVAYVGLSVSGKGYWGLIPISNKKMHKDIFKNIEKLFGIYNITIDPSGCDVTRLRILSYDPSPYFNHHAVVFNYFEEDKTVPPRKLKNYVVNPSSKNPPIIDALVRLITTFGIDITSGYSKWFTLGCFFNNLENGRHLFHQISAQNHKYNSKETDNHFSNCQRYSNNYSIGSLIKISEISGIGIYKDYMVCFRGNYELMTGLPSENDIEDMFLLNP